MRAGEESQDPPVEERLQVHAVFDTALPTALAGNVPVRVYKPTSADSHLLLVYFHEGAFFLDSVNTHDHMARALATPRSAWSFQWATGWRPNTRFLPT